MIRRFPLVFPALALLAACGGSRPAATPSVAGGTGATSATTTATAARPDAARDPLGPRPDVPTPAPYKPALPVVYTAAKGTTVWLLERHNLPLVSVVVVVPRGSSADPKGRPGMAYAAASMLDEGAGTRGALDFARAVDDLGASIEAAAGQDSSIVALDVLKKNLKPGFALLGDAVVRPRFDAVEWKRVHDLWINDLKSRASDPQAVAKVVAATAFFGADHPYGHPVSGTIAAAQTITLADAKRFYQESFRPDQATVVVVGDVTKDELAPLLESTFASWTAPATKPTAPTAPALSTQAPPRFVLVDRADAPQSVIAVVRAGVAASSPAAAPLTRVNTALGGSFTSRLNQDLREEHGWSYGAHSSVSLPRGTGTISASAAVITEKTGDALKALLADMDAYARSGMTDDEAQKTRSQARADLVQTFEQNGTTAHKLAMNAALGLPPSHEADASLARDGATKDELNKLAATYFDPSRATILVVGPKAKILAQLKDAGLPQPEIRDEEGKVKASPAAPPAR